MAACAYCGDTLPGEDVFHDDCFVKGKLESQEDLRSPEKVYLEFGKGSADEEFAKKFPEIPFYYS